MSKLFVCEMCETVVRFDPSEEEAALAELALDYPGLPLSECAQICDPCYEIVKKQEEAEAKYGPPPGPRWKSVLIGSSFYYVPVE